MAQTIVITGASAGIGRATALAFLGAGWNVGLMARRAGALAEVAAGHGARALVLPGDIADADAVAAAFARVVARFGRVDVLFNNAGVFPPAGLIDEISLEDWRLALDVNLTGMFLAARAAFGQMRRQAPMGGRIINNGSISAHVPRPGSVTYTATKHAVTGLTKTLSLDGRPFDIACGQIDIGNARTELLEGHLARQKAEDPSLQMPPMIEVGLVADAVLNMARMPLSANVQFMTLMATKMPFIGRG
jgi:NAD(P)-dependent dehydrogenase (short-subunit alcohol dehydrogenase family)